jgi:hypothetical protein
MTSSCSFDKKYKFYSSTSNHRLHLGREASKNENKQIKAAVCPISYEIETCAHFLNEKTSLLFLDKMATSGFAVPRPFQMSLNVEIFREKTGW